MKKFFVFIIGLSVASVNLMAARKNSSKKKFLNTTKVNLKTPTETECRESIDYCFNRYCFDKKTLEKGVYSVCGSMSASNIQLNVENCLDTRAIIKGLDLNVGCKAYTYNYIVALLAGKDRIESGLKQNTKECREATVALDAAKACWAEMIAHDGSIDISLRSKLASLCGYSISRDDTMVDRFYKAGDYGDSNIGAQMDMELTGQNTKKRENWRQVVDAVLAGYMEMAELVCGKEDYTITKVNDYELDSRENLAMVKAKAQADQMGRSTANRIVNSWFRRTDCLNSPLPTGGERWQYVEDGDPDCRLVCKSGYQRGATSSECVEVKLASSNFIGFNFAQTNKTVISSPVVVEEPEVVIDYMSMGNSEYGGAVSSVNKGTGKSGGNSCGKALNAYGKSTATAKDICKVFFPNCSSSGVGSGRLYERKTSPDEFFCVGGSSFQWWVDLTLTKMNSIFGTDFKQMGNNYSSEMSEYLKKNCASYCGGETPATASGGTTVVSSGESLGICEKFKEFKFGVSTNLQELVAMVPSYYSCEKQKTDVSTTYNEYVNSSLKDHGKFDNAWFFLGNCVCNYENSLKKKEKNEKREQRRQEIQKSLQEKFEGGGQDGKFKGASMINP